MKKKFLVAVMACAVTLSWAGLVNAVDIASPEDVLAFLEEGGIFGKTNEPASDADTNKAATVAKLSEVVYNAVYVNFDKNATEAEVSAFVDLFNLIKGDDTYANLNEQYYAGVTSLEKGIPGTGWDQLCKVKNAYRAEGEFKRALLGKVKEGNNEGGSQATQATSTSEKALPNTSAVR